MAVNVDKRNADARKSRQSFALRRRLIATVLSCAMLASSQSYAECAPIHEKGIGLELSTLGKQGDTIARARGQALEILQNGNACSVWFQEADPDATEVFRSLHFAMEMKGPSFVYGIRDGHGGQSFKHPWGAESTQLGGSNSTILLNANGPFFTRTAIVMQLDSKGWPARPDGMRLLTVSSYQGNTPEAQITILLHELGHVIGRLPEDANSWDGQSSRNTVEVLRHCKPEIHAATHISPSGRI